MLQKKPWIIQWWAISSQDTLIKPPHKTCFIQGGVSLRGHNWKGAQLEERKTAWGALYKKKKKKKNNTYYICPTPLPSLAFPSSSPLHQLPLPRHTPPLTKHIISHASMHTPYAKMHMHPPQFRHIPMLWSHLNQPKNQTTKEDSMIHPHIPVALPDLKVRQGNKGLIALITHESTTTTIPLPQGVVERRLTSILLHIASGLSPQKIATHFTDHTHADPHCPCCKLEGRILTASGRRQVSEADRLIASRNAGGGRVEVRHIRTGLSGAQLRAHEEAYFLRESKPKKPLLPRSRQIHHHPNRRPNLGLRSNLGFRSKARNPRLKQKRKSHKSNEPSQTMYSLFRHRQTLRRHLFPL